MLDMHEFISLDFFLATALKYQNFLAYFNSSQINVSMLLEPVQTKNTVSRQGKMGLTKIILGTCSFDINTRF